MSSHCPLTLLQGSGPPSVGVGLCVCGLGPTPAEPQVDIEKGLRRGGGVAQLVECRDVTPLTQVRFPGAARDFSPRVNFQCRLSFGVRTHPRVQSYALTFVRTLEIL